MAKHFKLTAETMINIFGKTLYRIECVIDCKWAKAGDKGGWLEKEDNLSGNAWVSGDAEVSDDARVSGNAWVSGKARVSGNAWVSGNARVSDDAWVSGSADYCCLQSFGSCDRTTSVFRQKDGTLRVRCGCFDGNLSEFAAKVAETHGDNKFGKEYRAMIELIKIRFGLD